jgi:hypothetical protein
VNNIDTLIGKLSAHAKPVAPMMHPYRTATQWLIAIAAYVLLVLCHYNVWPGLGARLSQPLFLAEIVTLIVLIATATISAALYTVPDMMQKERLVQLPLIIFAGFAALMAYAFWQETPGTPHPVNEMICTICISGFALLPAFFLFTAMRSGATTHPTRAGALAVLAAFSIGALLVRLEEQTNSIIHVIVWHYAPMLALCALGLWLGKKLFRW